MAARFRADHGTLLEGLFIQGPVDLPVTCSVALEIDASPDGTNMEFFTEYGLMASIYGPGVSWTRGPYLTRRRRR